VSAPALQDLPQFRDHAPDQERPLGGYATLMSVFLAVCGAFVTWWRRSGHELPERVEPRDLALLSIATYKAARLIAKDRVTSTVRAPFTRFQDDAGPGEVNEEARGRGLPRAIGELLVCPHCLGLWIGAGFIAGLTVRPRATRLIASLFTVVCGADVLQIAYKKTQDSL
jgi:Protein of unknown function (DUF1360)